MYKVFLAFRYLVKRRITYFAVLAVALCVFIVVVVMTIMNGLVNDFKESNHNFVGDCVVGTDSLVGFAYYEDFIEILQQQDYIEAVSPVIKSFALLRPVGSRYDQGVEIMGINPLEHSRVTGFEDTLSFNAQDVSKTFRPGYDLNLTGCVFGEDLLRRITNRMYPAEGILPRLGFHISSFPLTAKGALARAGTDFVSTKTFYYSDHSDSGMPKDDATLLYLPFEQAQQLCGMAGATKRISQISIKFTPGTKLQDGCEQVSLLWNNYAKEMSNQSQSYLLDTVTVQNWKTYRRETIAPMENEQTEMVVLFGFVAITTVFIIWVVFYMIISHKSKDIGILRSVGASTADILQLFLYFAFLIGLISSALGLFAGWIFLLNVNRLENWLDENMGFQLWDRSIYAIGEIPNKVEPRVLIIIAIWAIIVCMAGSLIPCTQALKQRISNTLQVNQI